MRCMVGLGQIPRSWGNFREFFCYNLQVNLYSLYVYFLLQATAKKMKLAQRDVLLAPPIILLGVPCSPVPAPVIRRENMMGAVL